MKQYTFCSLSMKSQVLKSAVLLLLIVLLFNIKASAQVFWTEDWTTGGTGWTFNVSTGAEGADPNFFTVSDNEGGGIAPNLGAPTSCGLASNGNNTLHVTSVFFPTGGAAYDAGGLCGLLFCPETNRRSESPTINCTGKTTISVNFNYIEGGQTTFDDATFYYFDGAVWTFLDNMPKTLTGCGGQGLWTSRTIALPVSADNNPLVKIAFSWLNNDDGVGSDPSFAVDDITLSTFSSLNTITTDSTVGSSFCACSIVNVPFTSTGTFIAGNTYTAQLSDAVGSFATPTIIGTLLSVANTGTIACTIPCATPTGTAYRIRVISSTPAVIGSDNGVNITINAVVVPSVTITAVPSGAICAGDAVTFTATPTNGGTTPTYQWQVNGVNVGGATSSTFTSSSFVNGDLVTVIMTSNALCASPITDTSNTITIIVSASVPASVNITSTSSIICAGDAVTFTAAPTNGGAAPSYQWQVNGVNAGTNSPSFTSSALSNGDVVSVSMTSTEPCVTGSPAPSNSVVITVNTCSPPAANFSANETIFCTTPACVNFTDLSTNSPSSWTWSFPGASPATSTSQNPTNICYAADGSYNVTLIATNADGSDTLTQVAYITVGDPIPVTITGNLLINACEETTLYASPSDGTYVWGPAGSSSGAQITVSPSATTDYYVTYTSPGGCTDSDTVTVVVQNIFSYYMPTGFSPNGDGINDVIQVHGRGIDYINLRIFDRIGEKVFETSDPENAWDGKLIGLRMNDNVFVYTLEVTFCNGDTAKENGSIMLAR